MTMRLGRVVAIALAHMRGASSMRHVAPAMEDLERDSIGK